MSNKQWRYETETKTIRSVPENYWITTMTSFEGAVDHEANARLIAAAPELLEAIEHVLRVQAVKGKEVQALVDVIRKARGEK